MTDHERAQLCPGCGEPHAATSSVPHLCRQCQRAETRQRHDRIVTELHTIRDGGQQKGGTE